MSLASSAATLGRQYFPRASAALATSRLTLPPLQQHWPRPPHDAFQDLVTDLTELLRPYSGRDASEIDHEVLARRMQNYRTQRRDWNRFAMVDQRCNYTRNLIDRGHGWSNLLLLVWKPGVGSSIHDHSGAHCVMKVSPVIMPASVYAYIPQVLQGSLRESLYDWPSENEAPQLRQERCLVEDEVGYMSDSLGLHKISNPDTLQSAVSLHRMLALLVAGPCFANLCQFTPHRGHNNEGVMCSARRVATSVWRSRASSRNVARYARNRLSDE
jgi:cysteine dioxygenase